MGTVKRTLEGEASGRDSHFTVMLHAIIHRYKDDGDAAVVDGILRFLEKHPAHKQRVQAFLRNNPNGHQ